MSVKLNIAVDDIFHILLFAADDFWFAIFNGICP